ncbi:MAG TPA: 50S ribosomal protein L9 [Candidatus Acidoferrum sp.]|nr:50S ribosomal protein L9 [Candidatus Acidoferrum sp.]
MKLILLADVAALGKKGNVVDVAEGYARNYLVPRKLGIEADKGALAKLGSQQQAQKRREEQTLAEAKELAKRLETAKVSVKAKAGGNGRLFGTVTNADVATAISESLDVAIDKHKIEFNNSIKALGSYPVEIRLHKNVIAKATVDVVSM